MFCRECGAEIDDDSIFCYVCGANIQIKPNIPVVTNDTTEDEIIIAKDKIEETEDNIISNKSPDVIIKTDENLSSEEGNINHDLLEIGKSAFAKKGEGNTRKSIYKLLGPKIYYPSMAVLVLLAILLGIFSSPESDEVLDERNVILNDSQVIGDPGDYEGPEVIGDPGDYEGPEVIGDLGDYEGPEVIGDYGNYGNSQEMYATDICQIVYGSYWGENHGWKLVIDSYGGTVNFEISDYERAIILFDGTILAKGTNPIQYYLVPNNYDNLYWVQSYDDTSVTLVALGEDKGFEDRYILNRAFLDNLSEQDSEYIYEDAAYCSMSYGDLEEARNTYKGPLPGGRSLEQMIINELYARHGYIFKSEELQEFFSSKSWYVPKTNDMNAINDELSRMELETIDFLRSQN